MTDAYKVRFIPAIFLVDGATGKCIAENIRGEQLATKLAGLPGGKQPLASYNRNFYLGTRCR